MKLVDFRFVLRPETVRKVDDRTSVAKMVRTLQVRHRITGENVAIGLYSTGDQWTDWEDVPLVLEE